MLVKNLLRFSYLVLLFFVPSFFACQILRGYQGYSVPEQLLGIARTWAETFVRYTGHVQGMFLYAALLGFLLLWLLRPSWVSGIMLLVLSLLAGPLGFGTMVLASLYCTS